MYETGHKLKKMRQKYTSLWQLQTVAAHNLPQSCACCACNWKIDSHFHKYKKGVKELVLYQFFLIARQQSRLNWNGAFQSFHCVEKTQNNQRFLRWIAHKIHPNQFVRYKMNVFLVKFLFLTFLNLIFKLST